MHFDLQYFQLIMDLLGHIVKLFRSQGVFVFVSVLTAALLALVLAFKSLQTSYCK